MAGQQHFIEFILGTPVLSAAVGGLIAAWSTLFASNRNHRRERQQREMATFVALQAEIISIISLMDRANYEAGVALAIQVIERTNRPYFYEVPVNIELFTKVYDANVQNLGLLRLDVVPAIIQFYANIHALVMNLEHVKPRPVFPELAANQLRIYQATLEQLRATRRLGGAIRDTVYTADAS